MIISRRQFLIRSSQTVVGGFVVSALPSWANALSSEGAIAANSGIAFSDSSFSPISSVSGNFASTEFNGDRVDRPHDILWDIEGFLRKKGGEPAVSAEYDAVIIGGGIAGLTAAYKLRDKKVLILDQDKRFGGNSKGEDFEGTRYSIGAAYISEPEEGSDLATVLSEIGLLEQLRAEHGEEVSVLHKNQLAAKFWSGTTDRAASEQFEIVNRELVRIYENEYPEIPLSGDEEFFRLDRISFAQWLKNNFGTVHPDVEEYFRLYGWSSFGGSIDELSAAQMINFVAAETQTITALPGGNSLIAENLMQACLKSGVKFEAGGLAVKLRTIDGSRVGAGLNSAFSAGAGVGAGAGVQLCYLTESGNLVSVRAKTAVFCAPKFVASKVISGLPWAQEAAMKRISYRSYVVANVLLKKDIQSPAFDLYNLRGSQVVEPGPLSPGDRFVSDVCMGDWANSDNGRSVLTLYMPLPYDGARQFLFKESSHETFKQKATAELEKFLPAFGLTLNDVEGIRATRWGHSLPIARTGLLADGHPQAASASIADRIFFANQDNFANPSFETAFATAIEAAAAARVVIS